MKKKRKVFPELKVFWRLIYGYYIKVMKFRMLSNQEFDELVRAKKIFPRKQHKRGRELGLILEKNGFIIIVWTTFLRKEGVFRDADYAWVDVIKDGKLVYPSQRIMRTKNFLERLTRFTLHRFEVVHGTPMCVQCRDFLDIVWPKMKIKRDKSGKVIELKNLGKRFRKCTNPNHKGKREIISVDNAISEKSRSFIMPLRKQRKKRKKTEGKKGKVYGIDRLKRFERREGVKIL